MSNPAELEIIKQEIDFDDTALDTRYENNKAYFSFDEFYEISQLAQKINEENLQKIVLQFTNEILADSVQVKDQLQQKTGQKIFILADSAKAGCCIDIVGAKHINPDLVVHFGDACLSDDSPAKIHIKYVFPKLHIDTDQLLAKVADLEAGGKIKNNLLVLVDVAFYHKNEEIFETLDRELKNIRVLKTKIFENSEIPESTAEYEYLAFQRYVQRETPSLLSEKKDILIIGSQKSKLIDNIKLLKDKYNIDKMFLCDPTAGYQIETCVDSSKILMKRYFMIEKAKEAEIFGILINKANIDRYQEILQRTKTILKQHNKKFYLFIISLEKSLNKLTEQKLGNFPEIDAYVIIACPYYTFYELKDFYKILINPFELEFAIAGSAWRNYILGDLKSIIQEEIPVNQNDSEESKENYDGRHNEQTQLMNSGSQGQLIQLNFLKSLDFHKERTYKGLDKSVEMEVKLAVKGKSGLAREYDDEPKI